MNHEAAVTAESSQVGPTPPSAPLELKLVLRTANIVVLTSRLFVFRIPALPWATISFSEGSPEAAVASEAKGLKTDEQKFRSRLRAPDILV
jgi:hypothetical protein